MRRSIFYFSIICFIFSSSLSFSQWKWATGSICPKAALDSWPIAVDKAGNVYEAGSAESVGALPSIDSIKCYFGPDTLQGLLNILVSTDSNGHYRWAIGGLSGTIYDIISDAHNNVYAFGFGPGTASLAGHTVTGIGWIGYCAKINSSGSVLWMKKISDSSIINSGAVDDSGNVYAVGCLIAAKTTFGSSTIVNSSNRGHYDAIIVKLDSNGSALWGECFGGDADEAFITAALNSSGEVCVGGTYTSNFSMGGSSFTFPTAPGTHPYGLVAKIKASGSVAWANSIVGRGALEVNDVATDRWNNVYVTGVFANNIVCGSDSFSTDPALPMYLLSYNSAGKLKWMRTVTNNNYSVAESVVTDICGNVWVSGRESATTDDPDPSYIFRFDTAGTLIDSMSLAAGGEDQSGLAVDNKGNLYLGGDYEINNFVLGPDTLKLVDSTVEALFVAKYNYAMCDLSKLELQQAPATSHNPLLFPNPATTECTIVSEATKLSKAEIYDMTGRLIQSYHLSGMNQTIDVSKLKSAIYNCIITTVDGTSHANKLVIIR